MEDHDLCRFLLLPVEIRMQIYEQVFTVPSWQRHQCECPLRETESQKCVLSNMRSVPRYPSTILLVDQNGITHSRRFRMNSAMNCTLSRSSPYEVLYERVAILRTCKTIWKEAEDVLYGGTLFCIVFRVLDDRERLPLPSELRKTWRQPIPEEWRLRLQRIRHLNLVIEIQDPARIKRMIPHLMTLMHALPPRNQLKSTSVSLDCEGMERWGFDFDTTFPKGSWSILARVVSALPLEEELRVLCGSWFAQNGKAQLETLNKAVGGRLKVVNRRKA